MPPILACAKSGNWVAEWLPQIAMLVTSATGAPAFLASCDFARFSSSRVIANQRSAGTSGALLRAMRQLVLHGLPTTRTRTSAAARAAIALPWGPKMPPLTESRSPRSMPCLRGTEPTSSAQEVPSNASSGVGGGDDVGQEREGAVVELHDDALEGLHRGLDLEQAEDDRLVGAEHRPAADPEEERVADLAGGAGHGDVEGLVHRWSIRTYLRLGGPVYSDSGRMRRLLAYCSRSWAVQPAIRLIAKSGVNWSIGIPIM